jgi:hypothetical protein
MDRRTPSFGVISGVLLLLAVALPFVTPLVVPAPQSQPDQSSADQNAEARKWFGVVIAALFAMTALGVLATLFAVVSLIRRERYRLLPVLVILIGGGGSAYLLFTMLNH